MPIGKHCKAAMAAGVLATGLLGGTALTPPALAQTAPAPLMRGPVSASASVDRVRTASTSCLTSPRQVAATSPPARIWSAAG